MKRIIALSTSTAKTSVPGAMSVDLEKIEDTPNCSTDTIFAYIFEYVAPNLFEELLKKTLLKLRPQGECIIKFADYKNICRMYTKNEISDTDFINLTRAKSNILSADTIFGLLDSRFIISKVEYLENFVIIGVQRVQI